MAALLVFQGVRVGHNVAAHPIGVNQLQNPCLLADLVVVTRRDVSGPADRLVRDPQRSEDRVVEAFFAEEQQVDPTKELPGLGTLNHAMVVRRGERHHLAHGVAGNRLLRRALPLRWIVHRADTDDATLALHEPRHRVVGPEGSWIGQTDRHPLEVLHGELVVAGTAYDILVSGPELGETHVFRGLDRRDHELASPVGLLEVDGQTEIDVRRLYQVGLTVDLLETVIHLRHRLEALHDGVPDDVGERHLATAGASEVIVDHDAIVDQKLDRQASHAGGGRDGKAGPHVRDRPGSCPAEHDVRRLAHLGDAARCLGVGGCRARSLLRRLLADAWA